MKPKCFGCGKKGNDEFYVWHAPKGQDGHLWHFSCWFKVGTEVSEAMKQGIDSTEKNIR